MAVESSLPSPHWLRLLPDGHDKRRAEIKFLLRLAALYATENGSITALSELCGREPTHLYDVIYGLNRTGAGAPRGIPPLLAKAVEKAAGVDVITREMLAPEVFED